MNRAEGHGMVTTNGLICIDESGRTARHIEGDLRLDYMCDNHYWVIVTNIQRFGESFPDKGSVVEGHRIHDDKPDIGEVWIPDLMVANLRWFSRKNAG